jgi:hypothetical protein
MLRACAHFGSALLLLVGFAFAGSPGTFLGTMVTSGDDHWIYVRSRNGTLRHVDISSAQVTYEPAVPRERRKNPAVRALEPGVEIRVTAEQDSNGEWRASQVEITGAPANAQPSSPPNNPSSTPPGNDQDDQDQDNDSSPDAQPAMTISPGGSAA